MKKGFIWATILCMMLSLVPLQTAAAEPTIIYLRPANFQNSVGSWTIMENEEGALEGINLKGRTDRETAAAVPASAQITVPQDGEYYIWARSRDYNEVPGTRYFQIAAGDQLMPKQLATHGVNGYAWEQAGIADLKAGKNFVKLVDTSCYYARCDAIMITDDPAYIPPADNDSILKEVAVYQADSSTTSVVDTSVPTQLGKEPGGQSVVTPPAGGMDTSYQGTEPLTFTNKEMNIGVKSANFFMEGNWISSTRGASGSFYTIESPASAIWYPNLKGPVTAKVSFFGIINTDNIEHNDNQMTFEVYCGDEVQTFTFDSAKFTEDGWVELGTFSFTGNGKEMIRFVKTSAAGWPGCSRVSDVKLEAVTGTITADKEKPTKPDVPDSVQKKQIQINVGGSGYFEAGPWAVSKTEGIGGEARVSAVKNAVCAFHPNLSEAGQIIVSVYNNPISEFDLVPDAQALYEIKHNGKTETIRFDMTQKAGWYELGTFDFSGDGNEYVKLVKDADSKTTLVRAEAVQFTAKEGSLTQGKDTPAAPADITFSAAPIDQSDLFDESKIQEVEYTNGFYSPTTAKIISDGDPGYQETGTWNSSGLAGYGTTKSRYSFEPNAKVIWNPGTVKGNVKVSIYKLVHENADPKAAVDVVAGGKTERFYLDFTQGTSGWVTLGVFEFTGSGDEYVSLSNGETFATCRANAVMFEDGLIPVAMGTDDSGKETSTIVIDDELFDRSLEQAALQARNPELPCELIVNLTHTRGALEVLVSGSKINLAKQKFADGYLAVSNEVAKVSVPLREINIKDGQQFSIRLAKAEQQAPNQVSDAIDIDLTLTDGEARMDFVSGDPVWVTITNTTTSDKNSTSVIDLRQDNRFVPAYIDGYGAFGETRLSYHDETYDQRLPYITPPVFAFAKINGSATLAMVTGSAVMSDMEGHWAKDDVNLMAGKGLVKGKGDGYAPEDQITRAEFATLLVRAAGVEESAEFAGYGDVADDWYTPYVNGAKQAGLLEGLPFGEAFQPDRPINRQEMAVMVFNAVKYAGKYKNTLIEPEYYLKDFTDQAAIADWAKTPVAKSYESGVIKGIEKDGVLTFSPEDNSTRAEAAVMLKRFLVLDAFVGPLAEGEWELAYHDEFDGDSIDWNQWNSVNGPHDHIYSSRYPENVEVKDGKAYLIGKKEERGGKQWTTASIWTNFSTTYGYFEAKYKYPQCKTIDYNIAFWLYKEGDWANPHYQEVDINEGRMPNMVMTALHGSDPGAVNRWSKYWYTAMPFDAREDFHTYALEWTPTELIWYVDGREIRRMETTDADQPMQVYLSTAIMKDAVLADLEKDTVDGSAMEVEYVRVYKRK